MTNKISRAARERMARTGEPYTLARRMVIEGHAAAKAPGEPEPAAFPAGAFLRSLLAPVAPPGPPWTHVLKLAETEEEMAAEPTCPTHTLTREAGR